MTSRVRAEGWWWCDVHNEAHHGSLTDWSMDHRQYLHPMYVHRRGPVVVPFDPTGHECDWCGRTPAECELLTAERVKLGTGGCCSACYHTDTHRMSLEDWARHRELDRGIKGV